MKLLRGMINEPAEKIRNIPGFKMPDFEIADFTQEQMEIE